MDVNKFDVIATRENEDGSYDFTVSLSNDLLVIFARIGIQHAIKSVIEELPDIAPLVEGVFVEGDEPGPPSVVEGSHYQMGVPTKNAERE